MCVCAVNVKDAVAFCYTERGDNIPNGDGCWSREARWIYACVNGFPAQVKPAGGSADNSEVQLDKKWVQEKFLKVNAQCMCVVLFPEYSLDVP